MEPRTYLLDLILERALLYDPHHGFTLASGKRSTYYFDCKRVTLFSKAVLPLGEVLWQAASTKEFQAVGGLTLGADPLVMAVCAYAGTKNIPLEGYIIRKEAKGHGTKRWIEGLVKKGQKALIVEDVITTGGSVLKAIERSEEAGLKIAKVVALLDREEGGREVLLSQGYDFSAVFSFSEIKAAWEKKFGQPFLTQFAQ